MKPPSSFLNYRTDKDGNIEFSFTMPEALTQWKLMTLAHTKDLANGYAEKTVITQKDLMVQPNAPRFLREGDRMEFSAKIVNLSDKEVSGQAEFQLSNASTMNSVDSWFKNISPSQYFTAAAGQSAVVKFSIEIPSNFNNAVVYRIVAKAGDVSDGEEAAIPVVTNRMLVTETMPLPMRGDGIPERSERPGHYSFAIPPGRRNLTGTQRLHGFVLSGEDLPKRIEMGDRQHFGTVGSQPADGKLPSLAAVQPIPQAKQYFDKCRAEEFRVRQVEHHLSTPPPRGSSFMQSRLRDHSSNISS